MLVFNPERPNTPKISRALKETLLSNNTRLFKHLKTEPSSTFPHIINDAAYPTILCAQDTASGVSAIGSQKTSASHSETNTSQTEEGERKSTHLSSSCLHLRLTLASITHSSSDIHSLLSAHSNAMNR